MQRYSSIDKANQEQDNAYRMQISKKFQQLQQQSKATQGKPSSIERIEDSPQVKAEETPT
jgi:hypothetical protein